MTFHWLFGTILGNFGYCWYCVSLLYFPKFNCWIYSWTRTQYSYGCGDEINFELNYCSMWNVFCELWFCLRTSQDFDLLSRIERKAIESVSLTPIKSSQPFVKHSSSHFCRHLFPYSSQSLSKYIAYLVAEFIHVVVRDLAIRSSKFPDIISTLYWLLMKITMWMFNRLMLMEMESWTMGSLSQ